MAKNYLCLLLSVLISVSNPANGCTIEGIDSWLVAESQTILDTFRGNIWDRSTTNILGISSTAHTEGLNNGPYVNIAFTNSRLVIATNEAFENYEEHETAINMGFTIVFRCSDGSILPLVFQVGITDTNNHDPQFRPSSSYEFSIAPPLPPGFLITNCANDIIVRDIDLTTQKIDFEITGSSLFQITYDTSTVAKEFQAALRTTSVIRSIPEPIILHVTATDVDQTGDPRRSATATITITADTEFTFPDEPVFSQPFYLATYTTEHKLILQDSIFLSQGFDSQVVFTFDGQHSEYFDLVTNENEVFFNMKSALPVDLYREGPILLVVNAAREYTSGASATVVVQLPDVIGLSFEAALYKGSIVDKILNLEDLKLIQGYEDTTVTIDITSDHKSYFSASVDGNVISLSMGEVSDNIINSNNFINLQLTATNSLNSTATTIIILEIIKDDISTPVFERNLYTGSYDENGLNLEKIVLIQGFDSTVNIILEGEHSQLFEKLQDGPYITLSLETLPSDLLAERTILVSVRATKPRTVGANTVVQITLPSARDLGFEKFIYKGSLENNTIALETIVLSTGYDSDIIYNLEGDYAEYFTINYTNNEVSLSAKDQQPESILENSFLILVLRASGTNTVNALATILLEIIQPDRVTPVFSQFIYEGTYVNITHVEFETISLTQGYDETVSFDLDGDNAKYFSINTDGNYVMLSLNSAIPEDLIFNEKVLLFNVKAEKPRTVGANAAIAVNFPQDLTESTILRFSKNTYSGRLENDQLTMDKIVLESGFTTETIFFLTGEQYESFTMTNNENEIIISLSDTVSLEDIKTNKYIVLEIEASRERAVTAISTLIIEITDTQVTLPVFEKAYYTGTFTKGTGLNFTVHIALQLGFDATVTFDLEGDYAQWFSVLPDGNSVSLITNVTNPIPDEMFIENDQLLFTIVALKPGTIGGRAAISIRLTQVIEDVIVLQFERHSYVGRIENESLKFTENIRLLDVDISSVILNLSGDHSSYFTLSKESDYITINLLEMPEDVINTDEFIVLYLEASKMNAINGYTVIILNIVKSLETQIIPIVFEEAYYIGEYTKQDGLIFSQNIRLKQGFDQTVFFELVGDDSKWFILKKEEENSLFLLVKDDNGLQQTTNRNHLIFSIVANSSTRVGRTAIIITLKDTDNGSSISFNEILYSGSFKDGVISHDTIKLTGFTGSNIIISGEQASLFEGSVDKGYVTIVVTDSAIIPENLSHIVLTLRADSASAVLIIDITPSDSDHSSGVSFDEILYSGSLKDGVISHDTIKLTGFTESNIIISGELAALFESSVDSGYVTIVVANSVDLPENLNHIVLILRAESASAVLILDVTPSNSDLPTITFTSTSYYLWVDINQIGSIGKVQATVSNGEAVEYSVTLDDYLRTRVSVSSSGEIILSAYLDEGTYSFEVTGIAQISRVTATASVLLRVKRLPECNTEDGLPPLIILDRLEEEPHLNLVVLNQTAHKDCWYTMKSLWPEDQSWLYVDNGALHARAIDREHESIAFMVLSQIQIELTLNCENDSEKTIVKYSLTTDTGSELDPYYYSSNRWVLADTITYNARRSVVNLIVEDINDNAPIFDGKENEPIYVGYPIAELENTILPRALIVLKATDADIGENAALMYWSKEENLAVAPTTGYVHVRNNALLENNSQHTVYATDQNGRGLNCSLDFVVKLLERNQIAVMTIRNAFLDDEDSILNGLSTSVGYNIKILRTVVISDNNTEIEKTRRTKREVPNTSGASLQLFVYGIYGSELIDVEKLTSDLDQVVSVNKIQVTSLNDHLETLDICPVPGQHTALLASTITLAAVLFIFIVTVAAWFFIKWKKQKKTYEKFSDSNSLTSRIETDSTPKMEFPSKPRLDVEELKRSERRLQEMLDAPVPEIAIHPPINQTRRTKDLEPIEVKPKETFINFTTQPIIIQSIDKLKDNTDESGDDEFGEAAVTVPRKSVVTFNENVEKIIHLEDGIDDNSEPDTEVYRF